jgi:hypothetical protein
MVYAALAALIGTTFPYFDLGANPFSDNAGDEKTYTVGDTLSWVKGRHSLKLGFEYKRHNLNEDFNLCTRGQILFLGFSGDPFKDFLGGFFDLTGVTIMGSGVNNRDVSAPNWGGFVNDYVVQVHQFCLRSTNLCEARDLP